MPTTTREVIARLPALPGPEFFRDPARTVGTACGSALVSYDPQTRAGFLYVIEEGVWSIAAPVDFPVFAALVRSAGYVLPESQLVRAWVGRCLGDSDGAMVH